MMPIDSLSKVWLVLKDLTAIDPPGLDFLNTFLKWHTYSLE